MTQEEIRQAFREKAPVMMIYRVSAAERKDIEYERISAVILRLNNVGEEIVEVELKDKRANSVTITRPELVYLKGEEAPALLTKKKQIVKHRYGEYKKVMLSDEELEKLKAELPGTYLSWIKKLDAYIQSTGKKYENHLATIRNWARREQENASKPVAVKGKLNNYVDGNKPDYSDFGAQVLSEMLGEAGPNNK